MVIRGPLAELEPPAVLDLRVLQVTLVHQELRAAVEAPDLKEVSELQGKWANKVYVAHREQLDSRDHKVAMVNLVSRVQLASKDLKAVLDNRDHQEHLVALA